MNHERAPTPDPDAELIEKGRQIFFNETFEGNGRTCGTCHPAENNFVIDPAFIASLPDDDPLFDHHLDQLFHKVRVALALLNDPVPYRFRHLVQFRHFE